MFGITQILNHARQWRASRKRAAMESVFNSLPIELQKDIGWPGIGDRAGTGWTKNSPDARYTL